MIVAERRLALDMSQEDLARRADVSHSYVSKLENGLVKRPGAVTLSRVAMALGYASIEELVRSAPTAPPRQVRETPAPFASDVVAIPIVGRASAGTTYLGEVHISAEEAAGRPLKAIRIDGDCLVPDVEPGDTAIIDVGAIPQDGEMVVVLDTSTGDTHAKWFHRTPEGAPELHRNDGPPVSLTPGPWQLQGVVVRITRQPGRRRQF